MEPQRHLVARSGGDEGMWTMVFDTGLEARIGGKSLFAHFLFSEMPGANPPGKNGDNFKNIAQYVGRENASIAPEGSTYACYCNALTTGFWHRRTSDGALEAGCFWGAKKDSLTPQDTLKPEFGPPTALVTLSRKAAAAHNSSSAEAQKAQAAVPGATTFAAHGAFEIADDFQRHGGLTKEVVYPNRPPAAASAGKVPSPSASANALPKVVSLRGVSKHSSKSIPKLPLGAPINNEELPREFDWRKELADMVPPGQDPLGEQIDQGPCGSCYAFAGVIALQMRFRVQLFRKHGILYPLELSYKSPSRCSPYTEGCDGGFSYVTMRLASEVGVPLRSCDANVSAGSLNEACDWGCYRNNKDLFFAKDYWHIGGFSHGSDEKSIMREIYMNGPVEMGFSTSAVPEFVARSGDSVSNSTDTMQIIMNFRSPKEMYSTNDAIRPWIFSTHAILGVGWGEETANWGMVKYWTVRNSWGRDWGIQGYAKMRRGNNDGGIEADATFGIPDLDRLPEGFLEKAQAYHDGMVTTRLKWKTDAPAEKKVSSAKKGTPEYCKQRPDSIDCN